MFRYVTEKIQKWISNGNKALLVSGARQVGKTYIIHEILKKSEIPFIEINFLHKTDILESLVDCNNAEEFERRLELYSEVSLKKGSIVFLDEIQEFPEIATKIKFLVERKNFHYILSGSLLGVELKSIRSVPVGYMEELKMFPMSLCEFALALGVKRETLKYVNECFFMRKPVDSVIHKKMLNLFYTYLVVGGMPAVVQKFVDRANMSEISMEQTNIMHFYKADFIKYEQQDKKLRIISIYENVPSQLNKQNLKFIFTYLNKELKFDRYENSFLWLKDAAVCIPVYIAQEAKIPLAISKEKNNFKLFLSDVGLLVNNYPVSAKGEIMTKAESVRINNGALFENFIAQEFLSNGIPSYYFKNKKIGEIDFLIEIDGRVLPIEIKSGKDWKRHAALDNLLECEEYKIDNAIVFSPGNVEVTGKISYLPIYMAEFVRNEVISDITVDYDTFVF